MEFGKRAVLIALVAGLVISASACGQDKKTSDNTESSVSSVAVAAFDYSKLEGSWYLDGNTADAHIDFDADGKFTAYTADGEVEQEGTVRYEPEEIEGTVIYWVNLYTNDGEYYLGFVDQSEGKEFTEFLVGNGGTPRYVLDVAMKKYHELEAAWDKLGFPEHDYTRHQLDAACDRWQEQGFEPSAEEFLSEMKDW